MIKRAMAVLIILFVAPCLVIAALVTCILKCDEEVLFYLDKVVSKMGCYPRYRKPPESNT